MACRVTFFQRLQKETVEIRNSFCRYLIARYLKSSILCEFDARFISD